MAAVFGQEKSVDNDEKSKLTFKTLICQEEPQIMNALAMKGIPASYYSKKLQAVFKEKDSKNQEYYT